MDQKLWHTKIILKRLGLIVVLFLAEQFIFFLNPSINYSKALFSKSQIQDMKHTVPILFDPTFVASIRIGLTVVLMTLLIAGIRKLIMAQDVVVKLNTTQPLRKIPKAEKPKIPAFVIIIISTASILAFNILASVVRVSTNHDATSANQTSLNDMASSISSDIWLFLFAALMIPIFEELVFRRLLIDYVGPSDYRFKFTIGSAILFGLLHMTGSTNILADALSYIGPGIVFAYLYYKFNNIRYGIYTHLIINVVAFSPLLTKIFQYLINNANTYYDILTRGSWPGK